MVPAGTPKAEGTGFGQPESIAVVFPGGPMMTGLPWGTGSSAQPGEMETEAQGRTDTLLFPSRGGVLTLVLWLPMGFKPSMPLGTMADWLRRRGRGAAPTCRSAAPAKAPVGGRHGEAALLETVATVGEVRHISLEYEGHRPPHDQPCRKCFRISFLECGG